MVKIHISLDDTRVTQNLNRVIKGIDNFSEPLNHIGNDLIQFYSKDIIDSQGSKGGVKWRKLSPSTIMARKKKHGYYKKKAIATNKALLWTGKLSKSFTKAVSKFKLVVGNKADYFKYHQVSTGRPPQRPIIVLNKRVVFMVRKRLNDYFKKILK